MTRVLGHGTTLFPVAIGSGRQKVKETPREETLLTEIGRLEKQLLKTGDASKEKELALALVDSCIVFAENFPDYPGTPDLLFKAADIARGAKEHGKAVQLWGRLKRRYACPLELHGVR